MGPDVPKERPPQQRSDSMSQVSENSQTAQEFINSQLKLEADAREALPYQFDTCTRPMGALRQILFSCLTCNPPPKDPSAPYTAAGVCYSCSISCHGEHTLVELFNKRDFVCDCGTTRFPESAACTLRSNEKTGVKGVVGEMPATGNKYNQNFRNIFCGCSENYDAFQEKGTMFQCLGLGTVEEGGCGEDWWHPECIIGLPRKWYEKDKTHEVSRPAKLDPLARVQDEAVPPATETDSTLALQDGEPGDAAMADDEGEDPPLPQGFPKEEDFEHFICYKCVEAFPWIKQYAGTPGFLPAVLYTPQGEAQASEEASNGQHQKEGQPSFSSNGVSEQPQSNSLKRKAEADDTQSTSNLKHDIKRQRSDTDVPKAADDTAKPTDSRPYHTTLPEPQKGLLSIFLKDDFRNHFCRCPTCFPQLTPHPQLLSEEEAYSPPMSEASNAPGDNANGSTGSRSLLDRGEAALSNMDRVRAIEGVMAYNHLKDRVKDFLKPFAESGTPVSADDIKKYFEKLRGDDEAMKHARADAATEGGGDENGGDARREQSGF